jgi:hypothetical protein
MSVPSLQHASFGRLAVRKRRRDCVARRQVRLSEQHQAWVLRSDAGDVPPRQRNNMHRFKPRRPQRRAVAARALGQQPQRQKFGAPLAAQQSPLLLSRSACCRPPYLAARSKNFRAAALRTWRSNLKPQEHLRPDDLSIIPPAFTRVGQNFMTRNARQHFPGTLGGGSPAIHRPHQRVGGADTP